MTFLFAWVNQASICYCMAADRVHLADSFSLSYFNHWRFSWIR